jgi:hypothetical protein
MTPRSNSSRSTRFALAALCVIGGCRWMLEAALPATSSTLASTAAGCVVALVVWSVLERSLSHSHRLASVMEPQDQASQASGWAAFLCGAGLFAAPAIGDALRGAAADGFDRAVALCIVPCFVLLASAALARQGSALADRRLWPALVAPAAAATVLPLLLPRSMLEVAGLLLPVVLCAVCISFVAARHARQTRWILAGAAVAFVALVLVVRASSQLVMLPSISATVLDAVQIALAAFILRRADAVFYSARFVVTLLLTIATAAAIERPGWSTRLVAGLVLFAFAAAGLLLPVPVATDEHSLLGL